MPQMTRREPPAVRSSATLPQSRGMSTLDSNSTLTEIKVAYADNASYSEDDEATNAAAFVTVCRLLLDDG